MIRAGGSNWLQNRVGLGCKALRPKPTQLWDNSEWIFANVFLLLLPASSGSGSSDPIGREEKRSYCPPRRKREETQGKPRCCEAEEGGDVEGVTCGLYGVSASAGTDRPNGGGGVRQKKKIYIYHQPPLNATTASGKLQYITFVFGVRLQFKRKLYNAHNGRNMWVILTGTLDDLASIYSLETSDIVLSIFSKAVNTNEFQNTGNHI